MLKRKLTALVCVCLLMQACADTDRKKIAQSSDDFARGISTALTLVDTLIKQNLISKDDAIIVVSAILDANRVERQINDKGRTYGQSGGSTKADLLKLASDLSASLAALNQQGTLHIKNAQSQTQFLAAMAVLQSALAVLQAVLGTSK